MATMFKVDVHAQITREANAGMLNEEQLSVVVHNNMLVDLDQLNSCLHFDNCAFACGIDQINQQWALIDAQQDRFDNVALSAFGRLLHTTQDFYAHSNWVELHLDSVPIPTWDQLLPSLPANIASGTFILDFPKNCGPATPSHGELNKDEPDSEQGSKVVDSGPHQGVPLFQLAFSTGVDASKAQFSRLCGDVPLDEIQRSNPTVAPAGDERHVAQFVNAMSSRAILTHRNA